MSKVLVIRSGGVGDSLLTLPVAAALGNIGPERVVHIAGNEHMLNAARLFGVGDGWFPCDAHPFHLLYRVGEPHPDIRIFLQNYTDVYWFTAMQPGDLPERGSVHADTACHILDPRIPGQWQAHAADYFLSILPPHMRQHASYPVLPRKDRPRAGLVVHPGSGSPGKTWPLERFLAVAGRSTATVTFLLGYAECDRGLVEKLAGTRHAVIVSESLGQSAELLAGAAAYLGNDSGMSHLAAACGVPGVVLFGPTDPRRWKPVSDDIVALRGKGDSLAAIGVETVVKTLASMQPGLFSTYRPA